MVVEYLEGTRVVFNNEQHRVMTNDPPLDWHWQNLELYANVSATLAGLPADLSSESRFQQAYYLRKFAADPQPGTVDDAIVVGTGLLNRLYIPFKSSGSFTPFGVLKIPSQRRLIWRGYANLQWHDLPLDRVDFSRAASWPVEDGSLGLADVLTQVSATAPSPLMWTLICALGLLLPAALLALGLLGARRRRAARRAPPSASGVSMLVHDA